MVHSSSGASFSFCFIFQVFRLIKERLRGFAFEPREDPSSSVVSFEPSPCFCPVHEFVGKLNLLVEEIPGEPAVLWSPLTSGEGRGEGRGDGDESRLSDVDPLPLKRNLLANFGLFGSFKLNRLVKLGERGERFSSVGKMNPGMGEIGRPLAYSDVVLFNLSPSWCFSIAMGILARTKKARKTWVTL